MSDTTSFHVVVKHFNIGVCLALLCPLLEVIVKSHVHNIVLDHDLLKISWSG